jgi:DNA ligase-1
MITRPMLAPNQSAHEFFDQLKFPLIASPKIDGLRCYKSDKTAKTRSGKLQPNAYVRKLVELSLPDGIDGELTSGTDFRTSTSALRREYGEPEFTFHIFDWVENSLEMAFEYRIKRLLEVAQWLPKWALILPQIKVTSLEELLSIEERWINEGYEGAMLRSPNGKYKCNRATVKEGLLYKLKRFEDAEALIVRIHEQMRNDNEAYENDLGFTVRTQHQENKTGKGIMGKITVQDVVSKATFDIGTGIGWDLAFRTEMFNNPDKYLNKAVITYKHLPHGNYDVPRNASMKGFREDWDR